MFMQASCLFISSNECCIYAWCVSGDLADLIFVFFDPIGQALCKRTLNLVEKLNEKHADRMRFYLSKADEAGHESDRQVPPQIDAPLKEKPLPTPPGQKTWFCFKTEVGEACLNMHLIRFSWAHGTHVLERQTDMHICCFDQYC